MLQNNVYQLFDSELANWQLAKNKYADLQKSLYKSFDFGDFSIEVMCNRGRIRSTMAEVKQRIDEIVTNGNTNTPYIREEEKEKCFLCRDVRPKEQQSIEVRDFEILVNPFPIFPKHFTIAHKNHIAQDITPYFDDFLFFSKELPDFAIFYNGANCGASAPMHAHFQAAEKKFFNVINDYERLPQEYFQTIESEDNLTVVLFKNYLRRAYLISTKSEKKAKEYFLKHFAPYINNNMLNIICHCQTDVYRIFVFPRIKFRPTQFFNQDETKRLSISPASVEMSGRFVTIFDEHFYNISKEDVIDIYNQIS